MRLRLRALERNIFKYRAFQMILVLFHAERLKKFIVGTIKATDRIYKTQRLKIGSKKVYQSACDILVQDGVITQAERNEIRDLANYRNDIAHEVHILTCDLSRDRFVREFQLFLEKSYDYAAL